MADKSLERSNGHREDIPYDHKWGFTDTKMIVTPNRDVVMTGDRYALSGYEMPGFIPFAEEILGIDFDVENLNPEREPKPVPPPRRNESFLAALADVFPDDRYTTDDRHRLVHSHGQTTADEVYKVLYGELERVADLVFFLQSEEDVVQLVRLAEEHDVCLVPYGGGTSVSCALKLPADEERMIVVVNTRRMNKILWIDRENMRACIEAGITGRELELALEEEGLTSGHEPDSLELSTLGGWIATNASGMKKNRYGNIEDIVENFTLVTPRGVIKQKTAMPRLSTGMQPQRLLFGNEGTLGLITRAIIRVHEIPEAKKYGSIVFPTFKHGTDFLHALTRTGVLPASIRLLDNVQFRFGAALKPRPTTGDKIMSAIQKFYLLKVKGIDPYELSAATVVMEGTPAEVEYQSKVVFDLAKKYGGISGGEGNGRRGYMLTYAIAYIRDFLADFHIIGETYETTVPWSKIDDVIDAVAEKVQEQHKAYNLPGIPYISPRITQLYHTGVCIYFTHGFSTRGVKNPDEIFSAIEHSLREAIIEAGGSISHHHGVGKIRKDFLRDTLSDTSIKLLQEIKKARDPNNVFGIRNNVFADEDESEPAPQPAD